MAPHQVLAAILAVGLIVVALLVVAAAGVYDAVTESDGVAGLDQPVLRFAETLRSPLTNTLVGTYTLLGGAVLLPVLVAAAAIGMAVRWRRWTPIVLTAATAAGSLTLTVVGEAVVGRARPPFIDAVPPYELSASFPSGHSLNSAALATVVAYLLLRGERSNRTRVLTVALAAAFTVGIGLSRVYLGAHWLTDVLVAWALGLAWATVVIIGHRLFLTLRRSTRANDAAEPNGGARGSETDGLPDEDDADAANLPDEAVLPVGGQGASVLESQAVPVDPLVGGVQGRDEFMRADDEDDVGGAPPQANPG